MDECLQTHTHSHKKGNAGSFPSEKDKQMRVKMALNQITIKDESEFLLKVPVKERNLPPGRLVGPW